MRKVAGGRSQKHRGACGVCHPEELRAHSDTTITDGSGKVTDSEKLVDDGRENRFAESFGGEVGGIWNRVVHGRRQGGSTM